MGKGTKRKKSDYYSHRKSKKSKSPFTLEPGLKGFICTCNNREKECIRESYNILNEYADLIYGEEKWEKTEKRDSVAQDENSDDDIDKALEQEVEHLKAERKKDPSLRRFQIVESGANNCLFIRTTIDDPVKLAFTIIKHLDETKKQKTRYLLRMIPIEITCKAWPEDIRQAVDKLLDKYFQGAEKSYSVVFNRRNNGNVPRDDVIREIAAGVRQRNPLHNADLKNPQVSIIVEIIRNMCCLAVVPDYFKYRRYNLLEVCATQNVMKDTHGEENTNGERNYSKEECDGGAVKGDECDGGAVKEDERDGGAVKEDERDGGAVKEDERDGGAVKEDERDGGAVKEDERDGGAVKEDECVVGTVNISINADLSEKNDVVEATVPRQEGLENVSALTSLSDCFPTDSSQNSEENNASID